MTDQFLIVRTSDRPLEEICQRLPDIAQKHSFGVLGVHDLRQKMESKGVHFSRECRVFEVCNPQHAQAILLKSIEVSTALPCRISVYDEGGRTILASIKPTSLLDMYNAPAANDVARKVEDELTRIMDEVCEPEDMGLKRREQAKLAKAGVH